jgi:hypothetical protein
VIIFPSLLFQQSTGGAFKKSLIRAFAEMTGIFSIPGTDFFIFIRHCDYLQLKYNNGKGYYHGRFWFDWQGYE